MKSPIDPAVRHGICSTQEGLLLVKRHPQQCLTLSRDNAGFLVQMRDRGNRVVFGNNIPEMLRSLQNIDGMQSPVSFDRYMVPAQGTRLGMDYSFQNFLEVGASAHTTNLESKPEFFMHLPADWRDLLAFLKLWQTIEIISSSPIQFITTLRDPTDIPYVASRLEKDLRSLPDVRNDIGLTVRSSLERSPDSLSAIERFLDTGRIKIEWTPELIWRKGGVTFNVEQHRHLCLLERSGHLFATLVALPVSILQDETKIDLLSQFLMEHSDRNPSRPIHLAVEHLIPQSKDVTYSEQFSPGLLDLFSSLSATLTDPSLSYPFNMYLSRMFVSTDSRPHYEIHLNNDNLHISTAYCSKIDLSCKLEYVSLDAALAFLKALPQEDLVKGQCSSCPLHCVCPKGLFVAELFLPSRTCSPQDNCARESECLLHRCIYSGLLTGLIDHFESSTDSLLPRRIDLSGEENELIEILGPPK